MALTEYLTYEEYLTFGGTVSEDTFLMYERKARHELDYITFDRIKYCTVVPDEVKEVMTEIITEYVHHDQSIDAGLGSGSKYSNGVETVERSDVAEKEFRKNIANIALKWLPDYLTARSVSFDVEHYLQSANNNPQ